jgi:hypothetical protein
MNEDDLIPPSTIREWSKDPAYAEPAREGGEQRFEHPLDANGVLVGVRFLHNFVRTREGKLAVERALDERFVELVPNGSDDDKLCVIPRLLWRDRFYDDLCPGKAKDVSIGIQIARYMLWGSPDLFANRRREKNACKWNRAILEALRRFEAERKQRRQRLAKAIRRAVRKLPVRSDEPRYDCGDGMVAISSAEIFELVRLKMPDVTPAELNETIMQTLPYMGGPRH